MSAVQQILDMAIRDPEFMARLRQDPVGAASAAGFTVSADELKSALGIDGATSAELTEALEARVSHSAMLGRKGAGGYPEPDARPGLAGGQSAAR